MNGNRSSCPDEEKRALEKFVEVVRSTSQEEFARKYINEDSDKMTETKSEISTADRKEVKEQIKGGDYLPYTTRELLARLIKCEAGGEGDDGMAALFIFFLYYHCFCN